MVRIIFRTGSFRVFAAGKATQRNGNVIKFNTGKKNVVRFAVLDGVYWGIMGSFGAYIVTWELDRGFSQSIVSLLLAIYFVSGFAGQFVLSSLCDRLRTNKNVFLFGITAAGAAQLGMYFSDSQLWFALCYAGYGFFLGPMGSILDAWMIRSFQGDMNAYSPARGVGSIGYAVVVLLMGQLVGRFGYYLMPICSTAMAALTLLLAMTTPDAAPIKTAKEKTAVSLKESLSILRIPAFSVILLVLFLTSMSSAPINNFKIMLLQAAGGDITTQGLDSFLGCTVQFLVFESAALFMKIPAKARLHISVMLVATAILLDLAATQYWLVIAGTMLLSISYGLIMPAVREIAIQIVRPQYHTTAIGVMDAFYGFLGGATAQIFAGKIAESHGIKALVMTCLVLSMLPLAVLWIEKGYSGRTHRKCA